MKILMASSEVVPFAKTGGLADVCGALPGELEKLGHEVVLFMPLYQCVDQAKYQLQSLDVEFEIPIGSKVEPALLKSAKLPGSNVLVYFVEHADYFDRTGLYGEEGRDYPDNCERFTFFSRSVLEAIRLLDLNPDVVHLNDWQTGLIPALLETEYRSNPVYENIASLITVHNLAYQGSFSAESMWLTGLDWKYFNWTQMEFYGSLNLLKTGLVFSDIINTVSPSYAREIQTHEQGCGLEMVLQHRSDDLFGILNGIDPKAWNPQHDPHIVKQYGPDSWPAGKAACKAELQYEHRLEVNPGRPLIGVVGRLASQKGWSLIIQVMSAWLEDPEKHAQWIVLGTGDPEFHAALSSLHQSYANQLSVTLDFSNELAHKIEAGSDLFLMPSEYEPCGLNQMYSMAYGTVPVVRKTGGLGDTVVDANLATLGDKTANGFSFDDFSAEALEKTLGRAVRMYYEDKPNWQQLINTGINHDWSWAASAKEYVTLYQETIQRRKDRNAQNTGDTQNT